MASSILLDAGSYRRGASAVYSLPQAKLPCSKEDTAVLSHVYWCSLWELLSSTKTIPQTRPRHEAQ